MEAPLDAFLRLRDSDGARMHGVRSGFRNKRVRRLIWPLVCNLSATEPLAGSTMDTQISLDVPRAMHFDCCHGWAPTLRQKNLAQLSRVLAAVFPQRRTEALSNLPHYYQGAHDIASVLLLQVGPAAASGIMQMLVRSQLQGFVRPSLEPAIALLRLLLPLVGVADRDVCSALSLCLGNAGVDVPHFALPWLLTWFSHNTVSLEALGRLFDAFLSGHPLLPLYVSAALLVECRDRVLALEHEDYGPAHATLTELPLHFGSGRVVDAVIARAEALFQRHPPQSLLASAPREVHDTLQVQWPEAVAPARNAWGGRSRHSTPWSNTTIAAALLLGGAVAAVVFAIGIARWSTVGK
jgi:TBC1 domain family member 20